MRRKDEEGEGEEEEEEEVLDRERLLTAALEALQALIG